LSWRDIAISCGWRFGCDDPHLPPHPQFRHQFSCLAPVAESIALNHDAVRTHMSSTAGGLSVTRRLAMAVMTTNSFVLAAASA
jgi:hypothetical protein